MASTAENLTDFGLSPPPCNNCGQVHSLDELVCARTGQALPLTGRRIDGKYRLLRQIGAGGMAWVWLAQNELFGRSVAIKILRPEVQQQRDFERRFREEARAAARARSPHICEVIDVGTCDLGAYTVMEYLAGQDLASYLSFRPNNVEVPELVHIVRQALKGLEVAHRVGIVHRDLKPGNIFLHEPEHGERTVKLMDFGVSKFLDGSSTAETAGNVVLGTVDYMAPEQLQAARTVDTRADIFAIGAVLYRALTGVCVYDGDTLVEKLVSMAKAERPPLERTNPSLPPALCAVIERCLERDPNARYQTAADLRAALAPYDATAEPSWTSGDLFGVPGQVTEPGAAQTIEDDRTQLYRTTTPVKKRRVTSFATAATIVVAFVLGGATSVASVPALRATAMSLVTPEPVAASTVTAHLGKMLSTATWVAQEAIDAHADVVPHSIAVPPEPQSAGGVANQKPAVTANAGHDRAGDDNDDAQQSPADRRRALRRARLARWREMQEANAELANEPTQELEPRPLPAVVEPLAPAPAPEETPTPAPAITADPPAPSSPAASELPANEPKREPEPANEPVDEFLPVGS